MNEQEWQACVNHVAGGEYPVPRGMISNYNDWRCRSTVGRALYWMDEVEAAMHVLATILDVEHRKWASAKLNIKCCACGI